MCRAKALVDHCANPFDKDALSFKVNIYITSAASPSPPFFSPLTVPSLLFSSPRFQCGDIVEVFSMNQVGIGHGRCRGQVGYFKMSLVDLLPDSSFAKRDTRTNSRHPMAVSNGNGGQGGNSSNNHKLHQSLNHPNGQSSVEEMLLRIGLREYTSVFILNGYEDLELFRDLEPADLDYLGILNVDHRGKILTAVQLLHDMDCKFVPLSLGLPLSLCLLSKHSPTAPLPPQPPTTRSPGPARRTTRRCGVATKAQPQRARTQTRAPHRSAGDTFRGTRAATRDLHCPRNNRRPVTRTAWMTW